jgi:hypothetical protein
LTLGSLNHLPVISTNQDRSVLHRGWHLSSATNVLYTAAELALFSVVAVPYEDTFAAGPAIRSGDSGYPTFVVIGGQPVLLCTWLQSGQGPNYSGYIDEINDAITFLGGGGQLQAVDLSSFNFYG